MPNWCENRVSFSAKTKEDMKDFKNKAFRKLEDGAEVFQFNNLIPIPKEKKDDWYKWNTQNWGTKWDVEAMTHYEDDKFIEMEFETAWAPPTLVYDYIYNKFPRIEVSWFYHEPGMQYAGYLNN